MHTITTGLLNNGFDVKILTIETHKHKIDLECLPKSYVEKTEIESVFVDTKINIIDAFSALITSDSYNVSRFFSPDFDRKLTQLLRKKKFDIIHLESLFMTPYIATIRRYSKGKVVLRSHNLEYIIWENLARGTRNLPKKTYLNILARQLKKYETKILSEVDGIAAISNEDTKKYISFKCNKPIVNIPFGIDIENYQADKSAVETPSLFHIGAMDWNPNVEGIDWFLKEVWPLVHRENPQLKLYLAGRNMPEELIQSNYPNVVIIGEVDDAKKFMNSKSIMIVPLLTAGGIRVKIIEAMALAKCVISTKIGADGIDYRKNDNILIADTPKQFAAVIKETCNNHQRIAEIGESARKLAENKYDNRLLTRDLINFYYSLLD